MEQKSAERKKPGPKNKNKSQYTVHMTEAEHDMIMEQCIGRSSKEKTKSDFIQAAIHILSAFSNEEYSALKQIAEKQGLTPGEFVQQKVAPYLQASEIK